LQPLVRPGPFVSGSGRYESKEKWIGDGLALTPGAPTALFAVRLASGANVTIGIYSGQAQYAVARNGRFLLNIAAAEAPPPIRIVLNRDARSRTRT
jgi:hypothetical protein